MNRILAASSARRSVATTLGRLLALSAIVSIAASSARALDVSVGPREVIYNNKQLKSKGLTWPDGSLGVGVNSQGAYEFYAPNGSKPIKTTGTLTDPAKSKSPVTISNLPKKTFDSVSGGPVYHDAASGARLMIYEAEKRGKKAKDSRSVLGLAVSTDANGLNFRDLGTIIEPNRLTGGAGIGGGSFAVVDDYLHVYYRDSLVTGGSNEVAVARAPLSDLMTSALNGVGASFTKYHAGSWSQPGRGGLSSSLEIGNPTNSWLGVSYNDYLNQLVMVTSQSEAGGGDLYLSTSSDGINWSARQAVARDAGEQFYPSLIGTGADPTHTGQSFYVYYTDSWKGSDSRWKDGQLMRRAITLDSSSTGEGSVITPPPGPPTPPPAAATAWSPIAGYGADFQSGTPAHGWTYAWNPTGTLGNSNNFVPLKWSAVAQGYNTTGTWTPVPVNNQTHHDDYLLLQQSSGHPGEPNYLPIAGYTIQQGDGAGLYRLIDSSIAKIDGVVSQNEDGLGMMVYLNNTLLNPTQNVSTNGLPSTFDRELGQLNVGDTIWVMVNPLNSHWYDSFHQFDFTIEKFAAITEPGGDSSDDPDVNHGTLPEPGTVALVLIAIGGLQFMRRRRAK